ncbi:MAG: recombinase RecT, partial [Candidatus Dojkabacteria bacterium]
MDGKFKDALPAHIPSKQFVRACIMAVQSDEKLLEADRGSLYMSCLKAAADGLVLDGREAALTVYNTKIDGKYKKLAQYMPMVAGIIKKARNTGDLSAISAHVVYENDKFKHILAPVETVEHESVPLNKERGNPIGVYAVAVLKSGEHQYCVMREDQVLSVKESAKTGMIWNGPFADQMWEKTAIRRLCKRLPSSTELNRVFENDDATYDFDVEPTPVKTEDVPEKRGKTRAAKAILKD